MACNVCKQNYRIGKTRTMNTKNLAKAAMKGATGALSVGVGLYAGKMLRSKLALTGDPLYDNLINVAIGVGVVALAGGGKASSYIDPFGQAIAGEALLNIANSYLPADYQVSGVDNASYALGYSYSNMAGVDNGSYALGGTFPQRADGSIPATPRVAA